MTKISEYIQNSRQMQQSVTFIAVSNGVEIYIEIFIAKQHEAQPWTECIDRYNKQDSNDPTLLIVAVVIMQMTENLQQHNIINNIHISIFSTICTTLNMILTLSLQLQEGRWVVFTK